MRITGTQLSLQKIPYCQFDCLPDLLDPSEEVVVVHLSARVHVVHVDSSGHAVVAVSSMGDEADVYRADWVFDISREGVVGVSALNLGADDEVLSGIIAVNHFRASSKDNIVLVQSQHVTERQLLENNTQNYINMISSTYCLI